MGAFTVYDDAAAATATVAAFQCALRSFKYSNSIPALSLSGYLIITYVDAGPSNMQNTIDSHSHTRQQKHNQSQNTRYRIPYTNIRMSTNQTPGIKNHTKNGPTRPSRHSTYEFIDIYSMCDRLFCLLVTNSLQFFSQPFSLSLSPPSVCCMILYVLC